VVDRGPGSSRLEASAFHTLASFLERVGDDGQRRVAARTAALAGAANQREPLSHAWMSPRAREFGGALTDYLGAANQAEPRVGAAFRALRSLADEARRIGHVIEDVEQYEKSWNQQLVTNWSEWQHRTMRATTAGLPWADEADDAGSAELTAYYQEQTRRTEEASRRREQALVDWHNLCKGVAVALDDAIRCLDSIPLDCPASLRGPAACPVPDGRGMTLGGGQDDLTMALAAERLAYPNVTPEELASFARSRLDGQQNARALREALRAAGLDPDRFDPAHMPELDFNDPAARRLIDLLDQHRERLENPHYAAGFLTALGPAGIQTALFSTEPVLVQQRKEGRHADADRTEMAIKGLVHGFAIASPDPSARALCTRLADPANASEQHVLALLLTDDGKLYDSEFLAAAVRVITIGKPDQNAYPWNDSPGFNPFHDADLTFPQAVALRALSQNGDASRRFVNDAMASVPPGGVPDELRMLIDPARWYNAHQYKPQVTALLGAEPADRMASYSASILNHVLVDGALAEAGGNPDGSHPNVTRVYAAIVWEIGHNHIEPIPAVKRQLANSIGLYLDDIAEAANSQRSYQDRQSGVAVSDEQAQLLPFTRPELLQFLTYVVADEDAAGALGKNVGIWTVSKQEIFFGAQIDNAAVDRYDATVTPLMAVLDQAMGNAYGDAKASADQAAGSVRAGVDFALQFVPYGSVAAKVMGPKVADLAVPLVVDHLKEQVVENYGGVPGVPHHLKRKEDFSVSIQQSEIHALANRIAGHDVPDDQVRAVIARYFADHDNTRSPFPDIQVGPYSESARFADQANQPSRQDWNGASRLDR
jgi:hypothetical protein